jgi:hypothetical protein
VPHSVIDRDSRHHLKRSLCLQNVGLYISIIPTHRRETCVPSAPLSAENQCIECSRVLGAFVPADWISVLFSRVRSLCACRLDQ